MFRYVTLVLLVLSFWGCKSKPKKQDLRTKALIAAKIRAEDAERAQKMLEERHVNAEDAVVIPSPKILPPREITSGIHLKTTDLRAEGVTVGDSHRALKIFVTRDLKSDYVEFTFCPMKSKDMEGCSPLGEFSVSPYLFPIPPSGELTLKVRSCLRLEQTTGELDQPCGVWSSVPLVLPVNKDPKMTALLTERYEHEVAIRKNCKNSRLHIQNYQQQSNALASSSLFTPTEQENLDNLLNTAMQDGIDGCVEKILSPKLREAQKLLAEEQEKSEKEKEKGDQGKVIQKTVFLALTASFIALAVGVGVYAHNKNAGGNGTSMTGKQKGLLAVGIVGAALNLLLLVRSLFALEDSSVDIKTGLLRKLLDVLDHVMDDSIKRRDRMDVIDTLTGFM